SYPVAPYLERRTLQPSVFHHGNRGLDRDRILREGKLFIATREELGQSAPTVPNPYRGLSAQQIHRKLRAALLGQFPWLGEPAPARITPWERAVDLARLFGFLLVVLAALSIPGFLFLVFLRAFVPELASRFMALELVPFLLLLIVPALAGVVLFAKRSARRGEAAPADSGGLGLSLKNAPTSLANPVALAVVAVIALGLLTVAMATVAAA